jgi:hypothetical protein
VVAKAAKKASLGGLEPYAHASVVALDAPDPVLLRAVASCDDRSDALAAARKDGAVLAKEIDALLAAADDNAVLQERHGNTLRAGTDKALSARASAIVKAMLASPSLDRAFGYVAELDGELAQLQRSDKAWQTTAIAGDLLQELTVVRAVAGADLGKRLRDRTQRIADGLRAIAVDKTKLPCD